MMNPLNIRVLLFVLLLVAAANCDAICNTGCRRADNGILKYVPGNVYDYTFESILTIGLSSGVINEADDTSLKVTGSAKVFASDNCVYTLQVGNIKVINTKESLERKILNNIQKPVRFTLASGQLDSQICSDLTDTSYSLNIKRAIISLLQTDVASEASTEIDVFGSCPTHTSTLKAGGVETVTKVRNLNSCAHRENINNGLLSGIINEKAGVTSSPLLQSEFSKESKIERGIVDYVHLVESYKFGGLSKGYSDVTAKVLTTLKLKNLGGSPGSAPSSGSHATSIIFQKPDTYPSKNIAALKTAISELTDLTADYVKKDSAKKFVELIRLMRNSDTDTLIELSAAPNPNKVLARKVYLDALFRTNTAESARAILKQLNKFEEKEKLIAILSLNLVESVDKETLNQASNQLLSNAPKEIYLAVGSLVAKYCNRNVCRPDDIEFISKKFTDGLKHCKPNTKKDEERMVYILKGIGNAQHLANSVAPSLIECASPGRSNRIRVASLQAFTALTCNEALISKALELLKDHNEDSELRIEAYLAAINCPSTEVAKQISDIVNSEKVYQVGGFIESNLRAIRDSTDPTRERQKYYLENIRVTKHFPKDYRRYSFNNEFSYRLEALGLSASSDYKLIYSQHGFLPRSARLNVTTEIFGTNYNVFEANIRQENLENLLEYYVGPKGLLNKDFEEIVKLIEAGNGPGNANGAAGRAKRSIADETSKIGKKYKTFGSKSIQDLNLDLSLKLFGSELAFLSLGDNIPTTLDDIIKQFSEAFDKAKKEFTSFEKEFSGHNLFLDSEIAYTTGLGFPLELAVQGFAANKIDFAVNVDVNAILEQNWQRAKYRLKLVPSIDVNVNVQIGFNTQVLSTGLRVVSSAHSATGSDVSVSLIKDGDGFNVNVEVPREKLELISVQANAEFYVAEQDKPLKSLQLKAAKKQKVPIPSEQCYNQLDAAGVQFCVSSSVSNSDIGSVNKGNALINEFHLSKPFSFSAYVTTEKKIIVKGTHTILPTGSQQWKIQYGTPGSKVSHDTSLAFELGTKPNTYGRLTLDNPQLHLGLEAGITNDNREVVVYGQYEQDKNVKKSKIGFSKNGNEYKPIIEIQDKNGVSNNINGYHADGKILVQKSGDKQARYNFQNFQILSSSNERIMLNGWVDIAPSSYFADLRVAANQQSFMVKSNLKIDNGQYAVGLFVNDERTPDNVYGSSVALSIGNQAYSLKLSGKAAGWTADSSTELAYLNADNSNSLRSGKLAHDLFVDRKGKRFGALNIKYTFDDNKFQFDAEATRDQKVASLNVKYQSNQRSLRDYELLAKAKLNKYAIDVVSKCAISGNIYLIDNTVSTSWGTSLIAKGELGQRYSAQDVHINLQGSAQFSAKDKPLQWILKVMGTPDKTITEFRLSRDNTELTKVTGESQHPQDKISGAKLNVVIRNMVTAKADFKIAKNGKGELTALVETQKTEQKHTLEIDSKFHIQAPKYDLDTSITLDGNKKIHLKTENSFEKSKLSTKNILEADNKKYTFEANGLIKGEWRSNGDIQGTFKLTTPNGRLVDGNINRHLTTNPKTHIKQGTADIAINDVNNGKKRSVDFKAKLDRLNVKTQELGVNMRLAYTDFSGQKSEVDTNAKYLIKGKNKALNFDISGKSNLLEEPFEVAVVVDEFSDKHAIGQISGKYGNKVIVNLNGKYNEGHTNVPASYELQAKLQVPDSKFKIWDLKSSGKLLTPSDNNGQYNVDFVLNTKSQDGKFTKINTAFKGISKQFFYTIDAENNNLRAPLKVDGNYESEKLGSFKDGTANGKEKFAVNVQYDDKYIKTNADISYGDANTASLFYKLESSFENAKDIEITILNKKTDEGSYLLTAKMKNESKSYELDVRIFSSSHKKGLDLRVSLPSGQPIVVGAIAEILGERKAKLTLKIENLADFDFKLITEAAYTNIDDFYIIGNWNSKKLQLDNYELDIKAQGKSLKLLLKNAKGTEILGTATYSLKKEQNRAIVEGQGQVQYRGKSHNGNFKLIRQLFDLSTENEVGFSYTFNGNFGPKNGVSTIKITSKEFNTKLSICEEKKQCINLQLQSTVTIDEEKWNSAQHDVLVLVDLRELGYPYELEMKSNMRRQGFKSQYNLNGHIISSNNLKYQITADVQPSGSTVKLALPKREILVEIKQQTPHDGQIFGHYEQSLAFYIDKLKRPNDVARLSAVLDISGIEQVSLNAKGYLKIEHPTIRSLSISGKLDTNRDQRVINSEFVFDIFRTMEQKIIAVNQIRNIQAQNGFNITALQQIRSSGLHFQYELNTHAALNYDTKDFSASTEVQSSTGHLKAGILLYGNKDQVELTVNALNEQIIRVGGNFDWQKRTAKINSKLQIFGQQPLEFSSEIQPTWAKTTLKRLNLIDAVAEVKLNKEFKIDVIGAGKPILNGRVALDAANFLQTNYKSNEDDVKSFLSTVETEIKKETDAITAQFKQHFEKVRQDVERNSKLAKDNVPDFTKMKIAYEGQLKSIVKELESDPSIKPIVDNIQTLIENIAKVIEQLTKDLSEKYDKLSTSFKDVADKLNDLWENSFLKVWEQLVISITKLIGQVRIEIVNIYTNVFKDVIAWLEQYGPALKNYGKAINEALKPLHDTAQELIKVFVDATEELFDEVKDLISKLPTFEKIRDEITKIIKNFKLVEKTLELLNNVFDQLLAFSQINEVSDFLQKLHEYLEAKLKQQTINDEKWLDDLSKLAMKAVRSALATIKSNTVVGRIGGGGNAGGNDLLNFWPTSFETFTKLPMVLSFRSSILNFLLNENWERIFSKDLYSSWVFFQDFELHGHIVDGQHVFSFDGQTYTYPGSCKYILAQDSVDKNFTVVAQLNNGKLKGITLIDRDGNYLEVSDTIALKVNGKPVEYPQHLPGIHAWRRYYTVHLHSEYGVSVICTTDLKVCHVNVNGFYTSKTRGFLGNGNAEPYDDFLLIDGTLASDSSILGNEYGVGKCNPVTFDKSKQESKTRNEICTEIFSFESPLALNFFELDSRPYRSACDIAVEAVPEKDKESVACTFALAYGSALKLKHKLVLLPPRCLKCAGPVGQRELGEEFTVKIPSNKADVVFVVDINVKPSVLANLVSPAITEIRESLKGRGFTDVQVGVIAYDENKRYPALLTSDNGKINYRGNIANVQLNGPKNFCDNCGEQIITEKHLLEFYTMVEGFVKSIVPQSDEKAFYLALNYPFRAAAAKSIVGVRSNSLEYKNWWKFVRAQVTGATTKFDGALLHLITPIKGLALEGIPTEKLVGFNARLVATLDAKDNKKRPKLQFDNDMGIDTVLNNGGWAFNIENFDKLKTADQKKVLNQVTSSISDTMFKTETINECHCLPVYGLHGQHKCGIKSSSFVPNKKPKTT